MDESHTIAIILTIFEKISIMNQKIKQMKNKDKLLNYLMKRAENFAAKVHDETDYMHEFEALFWDDCTLLRYKKLFVMYKMVRTRFEGCRIGERLNPKIYVFSGRSRPKEIKFNGWHEDDGHLAKNIIAVKRKDKKFLIEVLIENLITFNGLSSYARDKRIILYKQ